MRVVLISEPASELTAVTLLYRLAESDHEVTLCVRVDEDRTPLHERGLRGWWRRMTQPRVAAEETAAHAPLLAELRVAGFTPRSLAAACEELDTKLLPTRNAAGDGLMMEISSHAPDVIVRLSEVGALSSLAPLATHGVLTAHRGPFPAIHGATELEWTLFHGVRPTLTISRVPTWGGEDEAATVVAQRTLKRDAADLDVYHGMLEYACVEAVIECLEKLSALEEGALPETAPTAGLPAMATPLREVVLRWLAEGRTPTRDPDALEVV